MEGLYLIHVSKILNLDHVIKSSMLHKLLNKRNECIWNIYIYIIYILFCTCIN